MTETGIFKRNVPGSTERLSAATVGIAGCGGIGSNVAVLLARAGVGSLILADFDLIEESNLNRQHYFLDDIGKVKVETLTGYLQRINPDISVVLHKERLTPDNLPVIFEPAGILVEAFDKAEEKHWLLERWCTIFPDRPVVGVSGISGIGRSGSIVVRRSGNIYIIGDEETDSSIGLCSARVSLGAAMQANTVIAILTGSEV